MNKDVNLNVKIEETKTVRYFQPVITNNTVIIPAKRLQENVSEASDKEPVMTDKAINLNEVVTYKNLSNSFEEHKNEKIDESKNEELKIEEIIIEEVEKIEEESFMMKLEDMAKIFEEKQAQEAQKDATKDKQEEKENAYKEEALNKDNTKKMDLPFAEGMKTESIPQRREMADNLNEMKSKLFLLASNAKKPVRICVNKKVFLMGSDYAKMDCVIRNNRYISRCHAKIYYETGCYFIEDVGSMNGTYINGVKLAEGIKYKLETGDLINLADCKFEVDIKN